VNPVQSVIRDHIDAHFEEWRTRAGESVRTRAGARYLGVHLASLFAPPLKAVGLHVHESIDVRTFVTADGRQITRERLSDLIAGALEGHEDSVLTASVGSPAFFEQLAYRVPAYDGEIVLRTRSGSRTERALTATERSRLHRIRADRAERASSLAFLAALAPRVAGQRLVAQDLYGSAVTSIGRKVGEEIAPGEDGSEFFAVPRRRLLFKVADDVFGPRRRHARGTVYAVPADVEEITERVRRIVASLSLAPTTVEALTLSGIEDPEGYADTVLAYLGTPQKPANYDPALAAIAHALPDAVASAMASDDDPRNALGLVGKFWAERHPETRPAIVDAAKAFSDDLVAHVRYRVATEIAEEVA
jgi:hypothetical protein